MLYTRATTNKWNMPESIYSANDLEERLFNELQLGKYEILCYVDEEKGFTIELGQLRNLVAELHNTSLQQVDDVVRAQIYGKPYFMARLQQYYFNLLFVSDENFFYYYPTHVVNGSKTYVFVQDQRRQKSIHYNSFFEAPTLVIAPFKTKNSNQQTNKSK